MELLSEFITNKSLQDLGLSYFIILTLVVILGVLLKQFLGLVNWIKQFMKESVKIHTDSVHAINRIEQQMKDLESDFKEKLNNDSSKIMQQMNSSVAQIKTELRHLGVLIGK